MGCECSACVGQGPSGPAELSGEGCSRRAWGPRHDICHETRSPCFEEVTQECKPFLQDHQNCVLTCKLFPDEQSLIDPVRGGGVGEVRLLGCSHSEEQPSALLCAGSGVPSGYPPSRQFKGCLPFSQSRLNLEELNSNVLNACRWSVNSYLKTFICENTHFLVLSQE